MSIITAQNAKKDEINQLGVTQFSSETEQKLTYFVSIDTVAQDDTEMAGYSHSHSACKHK